MKRYQGAPFRQISTDFNIAYSTTIGNVWIKFLYTKSVSDLLKSGRPLKTTIRERRHICRISKKDPFFAASEVSANCNILQKVSLCIIRKYLRNGGLFGRRSSRKPFLSVQIIRNRKKWCSAYLEMDPEKWKAFILSVESRFQTYANMTRLLRRPRIKRYSRKLWYKPLNIGDPQLWCGQP